ncbi:unnamed protein product [Pleuronectes platessa]|uniref:Uncharacterized protein n=1 Tax=Pleuronectes platessa TaxID=8262 RepID=A0A9N7UA29_PLEPL|nr:unnamed protein product [Pleuronectes platessa]
MSVLTLVVLFPTPSPPPSSATPPHPTLFPFLHSRHSELFSMSSFIAGTRSQLQLITEHRAALYQDYTCQQHSREHSREHSEAQATLAALQRVPGLVTHAGIIASHEDQEQQLWAARHIHPSRRPAVHCDTQGHDTAPAVLLQNRRDRDLS